jgi:OOP family OmpA-OmpF porin
MRWSWATGFAAFCVIAGGGYYWFAGGNTPSNNSGVDSVQRTKAPRSLVGAAESKPRSLVEAADSKRKAEATACRNKFSDIASKGGITFKTGGAAFDKRALGALDELVRTAKSCVNIVITVEGHTDSIGSEEANKSLSQQRAQAVVDYFIGSGLDANLLNAVGYGGTKPIATNDTAHGRAQNRRIHFTVR